jgi:hypothetical protein
MIVTDLNPRLEAAFLDHLNDGGHLLLDAHIRDGGTTGRYIAEWTAARDAAAREQEITPELAARIITLPVKEPDTPGQTVGAWLLALLTEVWNDQADYGMMGNSDWRYHLYETLLEARLIGAWRDGYGVGHRPDGTQHPEDRDRADQLITAAIAALHT